MSAYFMGVILGFVVLMTGNVLFLLSETIFEKRVPILIASQIILLRMPAMVVLGMPVATLFAVLLTLGRLGRDSELIAMRTGGLTTVRIIVPIMVFGIIAVVMSFWLNETVVPKANNISQNYLKQFWVADVMQNTKANVFFHVSDEMVIYTEQYNKATKQMGKLTFFELDSMGFPSVSIVDEGRFSGDYLILDNGATYEFDRQGDAKQSAQFFEVVKDISREMQEIYGGPTSAQEMTGPQLKNLIDTYRAGAVRQTALETDYFFKFSIPVANAVFAMIGALFGVVNPRKENASGVIFAIACIAIYWILMTIMRSLGQKDIIEPWIAAWGQNIVFFVLGLPFLFFVRR
jgi:lipopolysaccharide export system permease protein